MTILETENLLNILGNRNMFVECNFKNFLVEQRDEFILELTNEVNKQIELDRQSFDDEEFLDDLEKASKEMYKKGE